MNRLFLGLGLLALLVWHASQSASATFLNSPSALSTFASSTLRATALSVGIYHTCAVTSNGSAKCWGDNRDGQLGDGTVSERHIPVQVSGLGAGIQTIAAGGYFSCALTTSGGVKCWGQNSSGQLGDGTLTFRYAPVDVIGLTNPATALAAGGFHACALVNGGVQCWGDNSAGQLGDGTTTNRNLAAAVSGLSNGIAAIALGLGHSCVLTNAGGVQCWGDNSYGQLGDGTNSERLTPVEVSGLDKDVRAIAAGDSFTCALMLNGGVQCWGASILGQFLTPSAVTGLRGDASALTAGAGYTCALMSSGGVQCWGVNNFGQLGDGTTSSRAAPAEVIGLEHGVTAIAAGDGHTCALVGLGIQCWGRNFFGELGDNEFIYRSSPVNVIGINTPGQTAVANLAAGWLAACGLTTSHTMQCWGYNGNGQLGDGTTTDRASPVYVSGLSGVTAMAVGESVTCALVAGGRAKCWGSNAVGQLGDGTGIDSPLPVDVHSQVDNYTMIAAGYDHVCALTRAGGVQCWGDNSYGQLGDGTTINRATPVNVFGLTSGVAQVSAGGYHTCARLRDGTLKCWGNNSAGQLGDGATMNRAAPVSVIKLFGAATDLSAGIGHTCALIGGGGIKCWGSNWSGQLGDGTTLDRAVPANVVGLTSSVAQVSAGGYITCAVTQSGNAKCWGFNRNGAVGDGTLTSRYAPVDVVGLTSGGLQISAGQNHACALTTTGAVKCWGFNYYGQLGNGESGHRTTPAGVWLFQIFAPLLLR